MLTFRELKDRAGWFCRPGEDYDVAVSSRIRLARNLTILPFPWQLSEDEQSEIATGIIGGVERTSEGDRFALLDPAHCDELQFGLLVERNLASASLREAKRGALLVRDDQELAVSANDVDHLRITAYKPGRGVAEAYRDAEALDSQLEALLPYAVSLELGYLTTEVMNLGTGLRASVMLHLPGLTFRRELQRAFRGLADTGMVVRGFRNRDDGSLGDMFQIANQVTIGISEEEILAKLDAATVQLVHYERRIREELVQQPSVEDRVFRAYGVLSYARRLSDIEVMQELSWLRFGIAVGIIDDVELADATSLFFLSQRSHVIAAAQAYASAVDAALDEQRARIVREVLGCGGK